ncbi:hypothetical protein [Leptospira noguchii]|uniref:hypothetical protein n=1 Tax=Leptospira noguchii TaxID=28182 RepID=UPI0009E302C5|nr:hypothetical protein [Leptospira noguchii]
MAHDRAFRSNSFGISATIAFAFVMPNSRYIKIILTFKIHSIFVMTFRMVFPINRNIHSF